MKCIKFFQYPHSYRYLLEYDSDSDNSSDNEGIIDRTYCYSAEFFLRKFQSRKKIELSWCATNGRDQRNEHALHPIYILLVDTNDATHTLLGVRFGMHYYDYHWLKRGARSIYCQTLRAEIPCLFRDILKAYSADSFLGKRHWCKRADLLAVNIEKESDPQKIFNLCMNEIDSVLESSDANFKGEYFRILSDMLIIFMTKDNLELLDQPSRDKLDLLEEKFAVMKSILNNIDAAPRGALSFFQHAHSNNVRIERLQLLLYKAATAATIQKLMDISESHQLVFDDKELELKRLQVK